MATTRPNGYTPVEARMMKIFDDCKPHTREELHKCLNDELGGLCNIRPFILSLRKKLKPVGETIACEVPEGRRIYYRKVKLKEYKQ